MRRLCILTALAPPFLKEFAEGGLNLLRVPAVDAVNGLSAQRVVLFTDHTQGTCSILPKASRSSKISNPTPFKCMSHRAGPRDKTGEHNIIELHDDNYTLNKMAELMTLRGGNAESSSSSTRSSRAIPSLAFNEPDAPDILNLGSRASNCVLADGAQKLR